MRKIIIILAFICCYKANSQSTYFDKYFKVGYNMQVTQNFVQTLDSNFIFYGIATDSASGRQDCGLLKIDKYGNSLAKKEVNYLNTDFLWQNKSFTNFTSISKSSLLLLGVNLYNSPVTLIMSKINTQTLDTIVNKYYTDGYYYYMHGLVKLNPNKYYMIGTKSNTITNNFYPNFIQIDTNLNIISNIDIAYTNSLTITDAKLNPVTKKIIMCGSITTGTNFFSGILLADTLGNVLNSYINTSGIHNGISQIYYSAFDNTYLTIGLKTTSKPFSQYLQRLQICKYDATTLLPIWQKTYGRATYINSLSDAIINNDGSIVACGQYSDSTGLASTFNCNAILLKVNANGDSLWMKHYDNLNNTSASSNNWFEGFYAIEKTHEGGYIMCGSPLQMPKSKAWVVSVDSVGCFNTSCGPYVSGLNNNAYDGFSILTFPNPANDVLNIELLNFTSIGSAVKLEIVNTLGKVVYQSAITNPQSKINIEQLSKGIYFVLIESNSKVVGRSKLVKQ